MKLDLVSGRNDFRVSQEALEEFDREVGDTYLNARYEEWQIASNV